MKKEETEKKRKKMEKKTGKKYPASVRQAGMDMLYETAGSALIAAATYNVALYSEFPMSGFSGIGLILYRLFGLPMGTMILAMNIPLALICWRRMGKSFLIKTVRCMVISSLLLDYAAPLFPFYMGDRMIAALMTGVLGGLGYALIYIRGSSTGGLDFIILMIKSGKPHLKIGTITFCLDFGIILLAGLIFGDIDGIVYGMIINFLLANVVDRVILGMNSGKVALIVTEHGRMLCEVIDRCSLRGSTILKAAGGYQGDKKDVVLVAGTNKDMYQIQKAVKAADPASFVIILESNEVHGEGFRMTKVAGE
jgi:uncharacterized membrane-anchored protein YitT (DUF2179 family)